MSSVFSSTRPPAPTRAIESFAQATDEAKKVTQKIAARIPWVNFPPDLALGRLLFRRFSRLAMFAHGPSGPLIGGGFTTLTCRIVAQRLAAGTVPIRDIRWRKFVARKRPIFQSCGSPGALAPKFRKTEVQPRCNSTSLHDNQRQTFSADSQISCIPKHNWLCTGEMFHARQ